MIPHEIPTAFPFPVKKGHKQKLVIEKYKSRKRQVSHLTRQGKNKEANLAPIVAGVDKDSLFSSENIKWSLSSIKTHLLYQ